MNEATANKRGLSRLNNRLLTILLGVVIVVVVFLVLTVILIAVAVYARSSHAVGNNAATFGARLSAPHAALRVRFTPNPPRLHARLIVQIFGLHSGQSLQFVFNRIPGTDAFGGPVGTFHANSRGSLQFTYPAFIYKQEIGRWTIIGYGSNGSVVLRNIFRVTG